MPGKYHIAFRCDASLEIGSGHVMRCLTLADSIRHAGGECSFLCRDLPGNLAAQVRDRGHQVHLLAAAPVKGAAAGEHGGWLGCSMTREIADCASIFRDMRPDRIVVDHYALDAEWEGAAPPPGVPVMVIDDLADRPHACDLLLDQNLGRTKADYRDLVPVSADCLIGPRYALLRPEFASLRQASLARRKAPRLQHLLVSMGGVDKDDTTSRVLQALEDMEFSGGRITIVMGRQAPWIKQVQDRARTMRSPTRVLVGVADMASLMASADLAIGAAGGTAWERGVLGLPSLLLIQAENQRPGTRALAEVGAAALLGEAGQDWEPRLRSWLSRPAAELEGDLASMSLKAAAMGDGTGTELCRAHLMQVPQ